MGYREHSYDPYVYEQPGAPMKPFNWVQWTGVAFGTVGILLFLANIAGGLGWIDPIVADPSAGFIPTLIGVALVNSRREPSTMVGSEQLARNRKVLLITVAICALLLGVAAIIEFKGA